MAISAKCALGTSSIDDLIDSAVEVAAIAEVQRDLDKNRATKERLTAAADLERAAKGLPPTATGSFRRPNGPVTYIPIAKHQKVADTPGVSQWWRPEYNDGKQAHEVGAGSGDIGTFVCEAHTGHLHVWKRKIVDICVSRSSCPFCAGKRACAANSVAGRHPDLARDEWSPRNAKSAEETLDGAASDAWWICPMGHPDYEARVNARTRQHTKCPKCFAEKMAATATGPMSATKAAARAKESERRIAGRKTAAAARPVKTPPVVEAIALDPDEETISIREVAALFGISRGTAENWVNAHRIRSRFMGPSKRARRLIPVSEVARVAAILGLPELGTAVIPIGGLVGADGTPAAIDTAEPDDSPGQITWFVPPDERFNNKLPGE